MLLCKKNRNKKGNSQFILLLYTKYDRAKKTKEIAGADPLES